MSREYIIPACSGMKIDVKMCIRDRKKPDIIKGTQCCGLGGCAGGKEPELAKGMACHVTEEGYETVYTYCASCAGNLTRNGGQGVSHLLTEILDYHEQPDVAKSMINRMKTRFW